MSANIDQSGYEEDFEIEQWLERRDSLRKKRNRELYGEQIYTRKFGRELQTRKGDTHHGNQSEETGS